MINSQGMMLSVQGNDYFVSYNRVPWLRDARISSALNVSLKHPERYPLVMKRSPLDVL